ncbi:MAG: HAMP domain-containing histidine kinase [Cyanobacteria bacterium]|nr:HAMP domain-containing histidine kinase [Cyanobacteriota bacterium]MDW8202384.1 HAMP domain-containing sensor histidine kinase [Cyanobacteriota bacterium SKYGB_h_bin112]
MFLATRRRLAIWYTIATAVLLLLFASGIYLYVRSTLIERIDDTLNHVIEVVQRSLIIEPVNFHQEGGELQVNVEASFRDNAGDVDDDHIDLEWFNPRGELLWSTLTEPLNIPLHPAVSSETVTVSRCLPSGALALETDCLASLGEHDGGNSLPSNTWSLMPETIVLRQVTQKVQIGHQVLGYLRVSHPWFEVTKPTRQLVVDLSLGISLMVLAVATIGWLLSGLAMEPIQDSYQRLKQFTADASHELRNPIATIQTTVQVALTDPDIDPATQHQQLQVVERLTRRLGHLVDDLLFLARQDSNTLEPTMAAVSLVELLKDVVEEQRIRAMEKAIHLSFQGDLGVSSSEQESSAETPLTTTNSLPSDACVIWGDRNQLARLFTNLVSNALQFTPSGGSVRVEIHRIHRLDQPEALAVSKAIPRLKPPYLQVSVIDTGIGIPADAVPHLFDRFYRVDPSRTHSRHKGGSGLGLAIAQAIAQAHHGHILVESQPGYGSTFTVVLPLSVHALSTSAP